MVHSGSLSRVSPRKVPSGLGDPVTESCHVVIFFHQPIQDLPGAFARSSISLEPETQHLWAGANRQEDKRSHHPLPALGLRAGGRRYLLHLQAEGIRTGDCKCLMVLKLSDKKKKSFQLKSL